MDVNASVFCALELLQFVHPLFSLLDQTKRALCELAAAAAAAQNWLFYIF